MIVSILMSWWLFSYPFVWCRTIKWHADSAFGKPRLDVKEIGVKITPAKIRFLVPKVWMTSLSPAKPTFGKYRIQVVAYYWWVKWCEFYLIKYWLLWNEIMRLFDMDTVWLRQLFLNNLSMKNEPKNMFSTILVNSCFWKKNRF